MLLLHQVGSLKIGEVVRYRVTYTPSQDRILPSPERLHVRVHNTSAVALRAAFVHGPYTLAAAAYPECFNPNEKLANPRRYGVPRFEPMVKAGGSWECELVVPDDIRQSAGTGSHGGFGKSPDHDGESATWVIEVASQVIFSTSAAVGYEVLVARDPKSLNLGSSLPAANGHSQYPQPGKISDHQQSIGAKDGHHPAQPKGVFSRAVRLAVDDTASLWNTPRLPGWDDEGCARIAKENRGAGEAIESVVDESAEKPEPQRKKKVHLVVLTHGLHSNLGADMLYLKESIDTAVKQAKVDAKKRRENERRGRSGTEPEGLAEEDDDEEVIVRGYSGNATKTERGIKYLGKRLARYVLFMTYPDQPYLPLGKGAADALGHGDHESAAHANSTNDADASPSRFERPYQISSISFVAHSLGGLVQTYAVAYIQKHSPDFFDLIKPINFITLATPFLGLSNENPLYVKFALDFGLVGRTGKDLGLTWRAPTIARSGWGAIVGNLGETAHKKVYGEAQPESKPLLRILPTGPAHRALKKFRNRTLYSNVVNDGIVPLRTSCLLFLDWHGLGRVEKARRDAGLVETVVGFGWAELTGTSIGARGKQQLLPEEPTDSDDPQDGMLQVPQPFNEDNAEDPYVGITDDVGLSGPLSGFFNLFRNNDPPKPQVFSQKDKKIFHRGQTLSETPPSSSGPQATTGNEFEGPGGMNAPPRTTFFESAGDLLNPKVPDVEYLIDPTKRQRTIFHDRVYHPMDIPGPPMKKRQSSLMSRKTFNRSSSSSTTSSSPFSSFSHEDSLDSNAEVVDSSSMRVEEKIARGYHRDLSWRKVLVKLEPDAHNNIFVRRMFVNAYGWPVIKHLVDAHFSDSAVARGRDEDEHMGERARDIHQPPDEHGAETKSDPSTGAPTRTASETREALDEVHDLPQPPSGDEPPSASRPGVARIDSTTWSDRDWADSDDDNDGETDGEEGSVDGEGKRTEGKDDAGDAKPSQDWNWTEKIVGKGESRK